MWKTVFQVENKTFSNVISMFINARYTVDKEGVIH